MGGMPRVSRLLMFSCGEEGLEVAEHLIDYVSDTLGGEVRLAPVELCHQFGTRVGVILVTGAPRAAGRRASSADLAVVARAAAAAGHHQDVPVSPGDGEPDKMFHSKSGDEDADAEGPGSPVSSPAGIRKQASDDGDMKSIGSEASNSFGGESDDGFDDKLDDDEAVIERLLREKSELEQEILHARQLNQEIQKKAANVLARSNKDAGGGARGGDEAMEPGATAANNSDSLAEKERHYKETMELIQECQTRLKKEQSEYEQQALDLQTRLDDKEFKAEEIAASLRQFKREILTKAENSRTGKGVSQRLIKQFEQAEMKKDEDLEKV
jgi:hypothetical protein